MTPTQTMQERSAGAAAAARGEPFDAARSPAWRSGWNTEARRIAARFLAANEMTEIDATLQIIRRGCQRLAAKGPNVAALARAVIATALADELHPTAEADALTPAPLPFTAGKAHVEAPL